MATTISVVPTTHRTELGQLIADYLQSCKARGLAPATIDRGYGQHLERVFLPWCADNGIETIGQIDRRVLDRYTADLHVHGGPVRAQLSPATIHTYVSTLCQFLTWCKRVGEEVTEDRPQRPRIPRKLRDVLTRDEIDEMERLCPAERDALIIRILGDTGIRVGELCSLTAVDCVVRSERRTFLKVCGKGSNERLVPVAPELVRRVEKFAAKRGLNTHPDLFLTIKRDRHGDYTPLDKDSVLHIVRGAASRAGIERRVHPHLFRHSFATEALRRGMSPIQLARVLGHTSLAMIERTYSHLNVDDSYDAVLAMLRPTPRKR